MGPVRVCGPRPGKSVRSFLISSIVFPGMTWLCECIIVSITTVSPESMRSTGGCALLNQPHCVVSSVAGSRCTLPLVPLATATDCACALCGTITSHAVAITDANAPAAVRNDVTSALPSAQNRHASISRADRLPTLSPTAAAQIAGEEVGRDCASWL